MIEKVYTPPEVAEILKISELTLMDWLRSGKLQGVKVGRLWRITESALNDFLEMNKYRPGGNPKDTPPPSTRGK